METKASSPTPLNQYGISDRTWKSVISSLDNIEIIEKVILFGSRAKGSFRIGSDIDLALIAEQELDYKKLLRIYGALERLELLYKIDVVDLQQTGLNPNFVDHINRVGIIAFDRHHPERVGQKLTTVS